MRTHLHRLIVLGCILFAATLHAQEKQERGLILYNKDKAFPGLNLFSPIFTGSTYLLDNDGRVVREWRSEYRPSSVYLEPNGHILRTGTYGLDGNGYFFGGGAGYCVEEFDWDGNLVWRYVYSSDKHLMHHDIERLPNGNVLILAWEMKKEAEALQAGRDPELMDDGEIWSEHVIEVKPVLPDGGEIVWEWHLWDHLIQDHDDTKDNYGDVAAHPERVDLNPTGYWLDKVSVEELEKLEALGYLGGSDTGGQKHRGKTGADWLHTNAVAYNPHRDEIALSVLGNNEIWIIDHSTTTEEARGSTGGKSGKGGDILYRWGNPIAYRAGFEEDQRLYAQHDVHWIARGLPGEGNLMIFNNGRGRPDQNYSSVIELVTPLDENGRYELTPGMPFMPYEPIWEYADPDNFYSSFISGARRLPNGNTIICQGQDGTLFEVTHDGEVVWRFVNPAVIAAHMGDDNASRGTSLQPNIVFRVYRYGFDFPAFEGRDLTPGLPLTEYIQTHPAATPLEIPEEWKKRREE